MSGETISRGRPFHCRSQLQFFRRYRPDFRNDLSTASDLNRSLRLTDLLYKRRTIGFEFRDRNLFHSLSILKPAAGNSILSLANQWRIWPWIFDLLHSGERRP